MLIFPEAPIVINGLITTGSFIIILGHFHIISVAIGILNLEKIIIWFKSESKL